MKTNPVIRILSGIAKAAIFMEVTNLGLLAVNKIKTKKNGRDGQFYEWKYGKVFYSVKGRGKPAILLHGFKPADSGNDMQGLANKLCADHRVYILDLPGFGQSEKPWITYTNYYYVLLIRDFINDIIEEDVADLYAAEGSCLFTLQAKKALGDAIDKVTIIDPCVSERVKFPKGPALRLKNVVDLPLFGTFLYNMYALACGVPVDGAGRHVFVSRLSGHLTTDITKFSELITDDVTVINNATDN